MSRVYQTPASSNVRRPAVRPPAPAMPTPRGVRPSVRPNAPPSSTNRDTRPSVRPSVPTSSTTRDTRVATRARPTHSQSFRQEKSENETEQNKTTSQERSIHVGDGYHMITPSTTKHEQIKRQAETEQRQYEEHVERTRLRGIHEVHRLGGASLSEEEVRRRQAEKYRREKFERLEKSHQEQSQKKQEEEKDIQAKREAARLQSLEIEKRDRNSQLTSMRSTTDQGASGWTDHTREEDRKKTMDRFFNKLTQKCDDMNISSNSNDEEQSNDNLSKSEKLSVLRDTLPHIDNQTLEYYLEAHNGNVDAVVQEFLN